MAGVLSFALGLEDSAFSAGLNRAAGRMAAFLSVGKLVETTMNGVIGAIDRGAALNDLSNRTGEAVGTLYQLEEAFKVVGISADSLPGMINRFNKSLSGVGDMGEKTDQAFSALGLSTAELKKMDAPEQISAVAEKLAQLDKGSGMDVASRLFGREGAANMMQITRDAESFRDTIAQSAREAAIFARNAPAFDKLGDTVAQMKRHTGGMFAGIAESLTPELQSIADKLATLDLVGFGRNIGDKITTAFEAVKLGKFGELMTLTLQASAQDFANFLGKKISEYDKRKPDGSGGIMSNIGNTAAGAGLGLLGIWDSIGGLVNGNLNTLAQQRFVQAQARFDKAGMGEGIITTLADPIAKGMLGASNEYRDKLGELQTQLNERAMDAAALQALNDPQATAKKFGGDGVGGVFKNDNASALEKMGFVMNGGSALDPGKQTASNTRTLVTLGQRTVELLSKGGQTDFSNQ